MFRFVPLIAACLVASPGFSLDKVRKETRVDDAISAYGVTGKNVIIAMLDRGIDYEHMDFRNLDGTTRIAYIFDLTDDSGAMDPSNVYGAGTIYTRDQINLALSNGTRLATRDAVGHGTTSTGLAAGNGQSLPDAKYRGIAPNATLLIVKFTSEGVPAHGSEPLEKPFYDASLLPVAIRFVKDKSAELAMPAVMLLNLGSQQGPTDGTSEMSRLIDGSVGPRIPGLVFVSGTGDQGGVPNRAGGSVPSGGARTIAIEKDDPANLRFDLWYSGQDVFDVSVKTPQTSYGPYPGPQNSEFDQQSTIEFSYSHRGAGTVFFNATNGKREILIDINGPVGRYEITLTGTAIGSDGGFHATLNPSGLSQPASANNKFLDNIETGGIWDGSSGFNLIVPNSYVIRTQWTDIDGNPRSVVDQGKPGELWKGSSTGPTFDGRLGVDVSAPGDEVVTAYSPRSYWATFRYNLIQDGKGTYGIAGAVSAANPIVTGIIALMLEMNPQLDSSTAKNILQKTARGDGFTGDLPNATWGYGKVDALAALKMVRAQMSGVDSRQ